MGVINELLCTGLCLGFSQAGRSPDVGHIGAWVGKLLQPFGLNIMPRLVAVFIW
jgi:hypothetical protein